LPKVCIKEHIGEHWIINEAELTFKESIGKGEFGEVKLGVWKNQNVAVKVLKNLTVEFLKEAKMMS
jgi:c-src tyrosine kinase